VAPDSAAARRPSERVGCVFSIVRWRGVFWRSRVRRVAGTVDYGRGSLLASFLYVMFRRVMACGVPKLDRALERGSLPLSRGRSLPALLGTRGLHASVGFERLLAARTLAASAPNRIKASHRGLGRGARRSGGALGGLVCATSFSRPFQRTISASPGVLSGEAAAGTAHTTSCARRARSASANSRRASALESRSLPIVSSSWRSR
jgi:hypothetical protein